MGIFRRDDGRGIERGFIELDDQDKSEIVVKWRDQQIRRGSRVTVDMDFMAVFTSLGKVIETLPPGQHLLEEGPSPLTAWLVDHLTADRYYDTELFFVSTRERVNHRFGGPVDTISASDSGLIVTLRVFGQHAFKITDPTLFLTRMHGSGNASSTQAVIDWVSSQVLAAIREELPALVADRGVLAMGSLQDTTEQVARDKANLTLAEYGVQVTGFGELNINLSDEDAAAVKELAKREKYAELAGGYDKMAFTEAFLNAGTSGSGTSGQELMLLNTLMNSGLLNPAQPAVAAAPAPTTPAVPGCPSCREPLAAQAKFCAACGTATTCRACQETLAAPGVFCGACGIRQAGDESVSV